MKKTHACQCTLPGCTKARPRCVYHRQMNSKWEVCHCGSYHFPHRKGSGGCIHNKDSARKALGTQHRNVVGNRRTIVMSEQQTRRLGRMKLEVPKGEPGTEPVPFEIHLPPLSHFLNLTVSRGQAYLHYWYWAHRTKIINEGKVFRFDPYEVHTLLWWFQGDRYSGPIGTFLQTIELNGIVGHVFDLTRYNDATGEVLGIVR